jgi:hypothetical protein
MRTSVASKDGPRTGWSGDGAPGDGSLRSFAVGAIVQHFTKTLNRVAGQDFRLPTDEELDALEAFMLSLGRQEDLTLPLPLRDATAQRGQTLFMDNNVARCNVCHFNAGANANPAVFGEGAGNRNFNTGVEDLPDLPSHKLADPKPPRDDGFGITPAGDGTFNTPPLVEAADTGPFFHNNARATLEEAVAFYNSEAFNNSPSGRAGRISLTDAQVREIAAFLRVINALENIRAASAMIEEARASSQRPSEAARLSVEEIDDAALVLSGANLHADAQGYLREAKELVDEARRYERNWRHQLGEAAAALQRARNAILAPPPGDAKSGK